MIRRFVALMEGPDPQTAKTVLATEDRAIVAAVDEAVRRRLDNLPPDPLWLADSGDELDPFDVEA